ncbi:MAG: hypothetical protein ACOY58_05750 [Candidatus Micrarchaeota archaeon]
MMTVVGLSVAVVLSVSMNAEAQRKKKDKEPELAICKRGKLIFEDDFSGKELDWIPSRDGKQRGEWKIVRKTLMTESGGPDYLHIYRPFGRVCDAVFDLRVLAPKGVSVHILACEGGGSSAPTGIIATNSQTMFLRYVVGKEEYVNWGTKPLPYVKPRWLTVCYEMIGNRVALTVDGRTITYEAPTLEAGKVRSLDRLAISVSGKTSGEAFAIDDVKVHEALPKDEGEDKDEKGKKKKK